MKIKEYTTINPTCGMQITDYKILKIDGNRIYVRNNNKVGIISLNSKNPFNNFIIQDSFNEIGDFVDGVAIYERNFEAGLIDEEGHIICSGYQKIWEPYDGIYIYKESIRSYGLIDKFNNKITDKTYPDLYEKDGLFIIQDGIYCGLLDKRGKEILKPEYGGIKVLDKCFVVSDCHISNPNYPQGLYDLNGKKLLSTKYQSIEQINSDNLLLTTHSYSFYIYNLDKQKKQRLSLLKCYYSPFNDKYIKKRIDKNYRYGLIDLNGNEVLEPIYNDIILLNNGLIKVRIDNKCSLLDKNLKPFNKDKYYQIFDYKNGLARAQDIKTYKYLLIDERGNKVLKYSKDNQDIYPTYTNIDIINDDLVMVFEDDYWKLLKRPLTNPTCIMKFNNIEKLTEDLFKVKNNDNYSLIYKDGTIILKDLGMDIKSVDKVGNLIVLKDKKEYSQIIDINGNIKLKPIKCERIDILNDNQVIIDNYLYDLDNIRYLYKLSIYYDDNKIIKSFNSASERKKYHEYLINEAEPKIKKLKDEHQQEIQNLEKNVKQKIKSLFQEGE